MNVSLMVTTYNWPEALGVCLDRCLRQTCPPREILVGDDGSGPATRELVERYARQAAIPIRHVWHEDRGFRLSAIRNQAIRAAVGDYIIVIDGDTLPERHFVEDHMHVARPDRFVRGSRICLRQATTNRVLEGKSPYWICVDATVLAKAHKLRYPPLSPLASATHRTPINGLGCNMAFWRDDAFAVNGFNEGIEGWGAEDEEFQTRVLNSGRVIYHVRQRAILYHLWHPQASREESDRNYRILDETRRQRRVRCEVGLDRHACTDDGALA